mgnify:CR=1 FL=1
MGAFRIVIDGVGAHGDDRSAKEGEPIKIPYTDSGFQSPDTIAKKCVEALKASGVFDLKATLTHWPGQSSEVVDDLVELKRVKGQF